MFKRSVFLEKTLTKSVKDDLTIRTFLLKKGKILRGPICFEKHQITRVYCPILCYLCAAFARKKKKDK